MYNTEKGKKGFKVKYLPEQLSEDAIGYLYIYKHQYNNSYSVVFGKSLSDTIGDRFILFDRREMVIKPSGPLCPTATKLTTSGGQKRFSYTPSSYLDDAESLLGDYEVVPENGIYKLYKIENVLA